MVLGNGCNSVDWIHPPLERQVPVVDYFEHANDFNVMYISCNRLVGLVRDQHMCFSVRRYCIVLHSNHQHAVDISAATFRVVRTRIQLQL